MHGETIKLPRSKFTHRKIATRKRYIVLSVFCSVQYTCVTSILRTYRAKYMNSENYCVLGYDTMKPSALEPFHLNILPPFSGQSKATAWSSESMQILADSTVSHPKRHIY